MIYSINRFNIRYIFERAISTDKPRDRASVSYLDEITLLEVINEETGEEHDPDLYVKTLPCNDWASLIKEVKKLSCDICGEAKENNNCVNNRFHIVK